MKNNKSQMLTYTQNNFLFILCYFFCHIYISFCITMSFFIFLSYFHKNLLVNAKTSPKIPPIANPRLKRIFQCNLDSLTSECMFVIWKKNYMTSIQHLKKPKLANKVDFEDFFYGWNEWKMKQISFSTQWIIMYTHI